MWKYTRTHTHIYIYIIYYICMIKHMKTWTLRSTSVLKTWILQFKASATKSRLESMAMPQGERKQPNSSPSKPSTARTAPRPCSRISLSLYAWTVDPGGDGLMVGLMGIDGVKWTGLRVLMIWFFLELCTNTSRNYQKLIAWENVMINRDDTFILNDKASIFGSYPFFNPTPRKRHFYVEVVVASKGWLHKSTWINRTYQIKLNMISTYFNKSLIDRIFGRKIFGV